MDKAMARPALADRISPGGWRALTWCAVVVGAVLLYLPIRVLPPDQLAAGQFPELLKWQRAGLAVLMALPIALLRRQPVLTLSLLLVDSVVLTVLQEQQWPLYLVTDLVICVVAATRLPRISVPAGLATLAVWSGGWALTAGWQADGLGALPLAVLSVLVLWVIGNSLRQRADYRAERRARTTAQMITVERLRIARELHDMIAHSIGIIAIQAGMGSRVAETQPIEARNALRVIESTSRETLSGLRRMLTALRQAESDTGESESDGAATEPAPGLADIDRLVATTADAGVQMGVRWLGERCPLPADIDLAAFRIIQEAVTNVVRHAGTPRCQVCVDYREDELRIEILDDGRGCAATMTGYGITGMRERVGLLRGEFSAASRPAGGFRVMARLPR